MAVQRTGASRHAEWRCGGSGWLAPVADLCVGHKQSASEQFTRKPRRCGLAKVFHRCAGGLGAVVVRDPGLQRKDLRDLLRDSGDYHRHPALRAPMVLGKASACGAIGMAHGCWLSPFVGITLLWSQMITNGPTRRSSEREPGGTPSGDADAAGGWPPSLTFAFGHVDVCDRELSDRPIGVSNIAGRSCGFAGGSS